MIMAETARALGAGGARELGPGPGERERLAANAIAAAPMLFRRPFSAPATQPRPRLETAHPPEALAEAAERAANRLARSLPLASAAYGLTPGQRIAAGLAVAGAVGFAAAAPELIAPAGRLLAGLGFGLLALFRIAALLTPPPQPAPPARGRPPVYTIIAPLYREASVLPALIEAIEALDHPADRLDVKIVLEADDAETIAVARALDLRPPFEVLVVPPGAPRTKPRALNFALAFARGALVTVYDAEDRPHPGQLKAAVAAFAAGGPRLGCVQAPLGWYNCEETWLTRQFALEYAANFHVVLPALARWGWALPLGGTSNHFRRTALEAVGGWDPYNVTEDADLGFRLAAQGWRVGVIAPATLEEAVTTFPAWRRQRTRWIKGHMQSWGVQMRAPQRLCAGAGLGGLAGLQLTIGLGVVSALLHGPLAFLALGALAAAALGWPAPRLEPIDLGLLALGYGAAAAVALTGLARAGERGLGREVLAMPLYWPLQSWAAGGALWDLARRPFHWDKTAHGRTRLSTAPAHRPSPAEGEVCGLP